MQASDLVRPKRMVAHFKPRATQADRGGLFDGKAYGIGGGAELAWTLCERRCGIAAKEQLPRRVQNLDIHSVFLSALGR